MKTSLLISVLFFISHLTAFSQMDSTAMVADIYQRAARFYETDKFSDALILIERAGALSSKPDAKILYLKSKVLEAVWKLLKAGRRAIFVSTKMQSNDQTVEATDRRPVGCNFPFFTT